MKLYEIHNETLTLSNFADEIGVTFNKAEKYFMANPDGSVTYYPKLGNANDNILLRHFEFEHVDFSNVHTRIRSMLDVILNYCKFNDFKWVPTNCENIEMTGCTIHSADGLANEFDELHFNTCFIQNEITLPREMNKLAIRYTKIDKIVFPREVAEYTVLTLVDIPETLLNTSKRKCKTKSLHIRECYVETESGKRPIKIADIDKLFDYEEVEFE